LPNLVSEESDSAPLRHSKAFQLHNLKKYQSPVGPKVNSWVRCRSDITVHGQVIASVENDINTLSEDTQTHAFRQSHVEEFFDWVVGEMDHILSLYFPKDESP
jgi:hypothetical protein